MRDLILESPILYKIYLHLRKGQKAKTILDKDISVVVDGFPRSGNTFSYYICKEIFPHIKTAHHLHRIAPLKILSKKAPVIIIIRNPFECLSSLYLLNFNKKKIPKKVDLKLLRMLCNDYTKYYRFVHKNNFLIVQFDDLILNPKILLDKVAIIAKSDYNPVDINNLVLQYKKKARNQAVTSSSLPNSYKEKEKDIIKIWLAQTREMRGCQKIYKKLIKNSAKSAAH